MQGRIAILMIASLLFSVLIIRNIRNTSLQPAFDPIYMLLMICILSVISVIPGFNGMITSFWFLSFIISFGIYYLGLWLLMPVLRKRYRPVFTAVLWLIPNVLFVLRGMKSPVLIPLVMIPVSKKMIMGFMIVWLLGFFVALTARIIKHLDFRKEVLIDAYPVHDSETLKLFAALRNTMGYNKEIPLIVSPHLKEPLSIGITKCSLRVVLPDTVYSEEELNIIFRNELTHILRKDIQIKCYTAVLSSACWFIPSIYPSMKVCLEDFDLAAEESVTEGLTQEEKKLYASLELNKRQDDRGFTSCLSAERSAQHKNYDQTAEDSRKKYSFVFLACVTFLALVSFGAVSFDWNRTNLQSAVFDRFGEQTMERVSYRESYLDTESVELNCLDSEGVMKYLSEIKISESCINREMMNDPSILIIEFGDGKPEYTVAVYSHMIGVTKHDGQEFDRLYWMAGQTDWDKLLSYFQS